MLIVCSGPDTFRALRKARELEVAFKQKYDAQGLSVERVESGKGAVDSIAARAGAISLFAPRRFVRTAQLLTESTKAQRATLKRVLAHDQEGFIVVTVEDEAPQAVILKEFGDGVKVVRYDFPLLQGRAFLEWTLGEARVLGVQDEAIVRRVVEATEGDSGSCFFELMKRAASPAVEFVGREQGLDSAFACADAYVTGNRHWLTAASSLEMARQLPSAFLSQARAAVRVRDGATEGIHPFVVKKLRGKRLDDASAIFARALEGFWMQRSGYGDEREVMAVF